MRVRSTSGMDDDTPAAGFAADDIGAAHGLQPRSRRARVVWSIVSAVIAMTHEISLSQELISHQPITGEIGKRQSLKVLNYFEHNARCAYRRGVFAGAKTGDRGFPPGSSIAPPFGAGRSLGLLASRPVVVWSSFPLWPASGDAVLRGCWPAPSYAPYPAQPPGLVHPVIAGKSSITPPLPAGARCTARQHPR